MGSYQLTIFSILLMVSAAPAKADEVRSQALPSFCKALFPKIVPGTDRPLSMSEIQRLLRLPKQSTLSHLEKRDLLEKLILLHWQIPELSAQEIPDEIRPTETEVYERFPRAKDLVSKKPEILEKLERSILKKKVWDLAEGLATELGQKASATERKEFFRKFLDHVDYHDQSWYHQAKIDSLIDLVSGIKTKQISEQIQNENRRSFNDRHEGEETYSFAGPELLLTPYTEILNLFKSVDLKPGDTVVDLGAGFGRLGLALGVRYPNVDITGYEIVRDRIEEGARIAKEWGLDSSVHLLEQNLADPKFKPKAADVYYAFNPVSGTTFDKILEDLRLVGLQAGKKFKLIVFGPSPFFKTDAQPWLKELKGKGIPQGEELKIYEFVPDKATHTEIVNPGGITNPFQLRPVEDLTLYPKTEPLNDKHLKTLVQHLAQFPELPRNDASFLSPHYLTAWASAWPMKISRLGNQIIVSSEKTNEPGKESFVEPLGGSPQEKASAIRKIMSDKKRQGLKAEFSFVSEEVAKLLKVDSEVVAAENKEYDDFIYPAENLAKLDKSKKLRDRAHQADSFLNAHPEINVAILSRLENEQAKQFKKATQEFLDSWLGHKREESGLSSFERAQLETEGAASKVLSDRLTTPNTIQMVVSGAGDSMGSRRVIAFAAGEIREVSNGKRTLIVYVQKSDGTKNAIPFINRELVREVYDHPERYGKIDYINMMDAATTGLRQFKNQYEPDRSLGKTFSVSEKAADTFGTEIGHLR